MSEWTDELKKQVVEAYTSKNPTPETTTDIVAELAEEFNKTANGVRNILTREKVYVSKAAAKSTTSGEDKPKKKSKQDSIDELIALIEDNGATIDEAITSKLTGKAAEAFSAVIKTLIENSD